MRNTPRCTPLPCSSTQTLNRPWSCVRVHSVHIQSSLYTGRAGHGRRARGRPGEDDPTTPAQQVWLASRHEGNAVRSRRGTHRLGSARTPVEAVGASASSARLSWRPMPAGPPSADPARKPRIALARNAHLGEYRCKGVSSSSRGVAPSSSSLSSLLSGMVTAVAPAGAVLSVVAAADPDLVTARHTSPHAAPSRPSQLGLPCLCDGLWQDARWRRGPCGAQTAHERGALGGPGRRARRACILLAQRAVALRRVFPWMGVSRNQDSGKQRPVPSVCSSSCAALYLARREPRVDAELVKVVVARQHLCIHTEARVRRGQMAASQHYDGGRAGHAPAAPRRRHSPRGRWRTRRRASAAPRLSCRRAGAAGTQSRAARARTAVPPRVPCPGLLSPVARSAEVGGRARGRAGARTSRTADERVRSRHSEYMSTMMMSGATMRAITMSSIGHA